MRVKTKDGNNFWELWSLWIDNGRPTNIVFRPVRKSSENVVSKQMITHAAAPPPLFFLADDHFEAVFGRISPYNLPLAWRKWRLFSVSLMQLTLVHIICRNSRATMTSLQRGIFQPHGVQPTMLIASIRSGDNFSASCV